ncbi:biotin/lipoyl-binding protein [Lutibacter sp. B2]|nr:biotin/lipoyl-binding protein [Lutibacter sp. B2]
MKKFNVTVNGNIYEVEVEEVGGVQTAAPVARAAAPAARPAAAPKAAPKAAAVAAPAGASTITSPMPGTIFDLKVKEGDTVENGQVLLILEAMKMENEIVAPQAGKVVSISVAKGAAVNAGDVLVVLG